MTHIFDKKYYETKYNLSFQNNDEAENHYNITGKKKGYFPSLQSEIFFCMKDLSTIAPCNVFCSNY